MNIKEFPLSVCRFSGARNGWVRSGPAPSEKETACGHMVPQHLKVNNFFFLPLRKKKGFLNRAFDPFDPPSVSSDRSVMG